MMNAPHPDPSREEVQLLRGLLSDTIRQCEGEEALQLVDLLHSVSRDDEGGRRITDESARELVRQLSFDQLRVAIRAFTVTLDLMNVVEDRRRVRVLEERARKVYPRPRGESIREVIAKLHRSGLSGDEIEELVRQLHIELVFTAHPTEAKRRSVRSKLRGIRDLMGQMDHVSGPEQRDQLERSLRGEIAKLWQTDFIRPWRPSVMQEVGRGLSIKPVLWDQVPRISAALQTALRENGAVGRDGLRSCVTFGSWIGGDRDGHPGVTADITKEAFGWMRREAIAFHLRACDRISDSLSLSQRQVDLGVRLSEAIEAAVGTSKELDERLSLFPPGELCRRWLAVIRWRLENTPGHPGGEKDDSSSEDSDTAGYDSACDLAGDVAILFDSLVALPGSEVCAEEVSDWRTQIETFGFHLARLDVRQNARVHSDVFQEIAEKLNLGAAAGVEGSPADWSEEQLCRVLTATMDGRWDLAATSFSDQASETLSLFAVLHGVVEEFSPSAIGSHIISMTSSLSDVLTVQWLWKVTDDAMGPEVAAPRFGIPIVPLLETIEDLHAGPAILEGMLACPEYRQYLQSQGDRQTVMLGYSDSTKDGGYVAACWALNEGQLALTEVAEKHGVTLTFFHGRGGSLGRGGGPAARSILSLPSGTMRGHLRLTEQGEVLADRYDDPRIAYRHLEQLVSSALMATGRPAPPPKPMWRETMSAISETAFAAYRHLVETEGFVDFFRRVTPISEIEQLPIGSRPSRRKPGGGLQDLRAIPWVFSWTQSRCVLPAWFGLGAGVESVLAQPGGSEVLTEMYESWPFFRGMIDNAELALAKSDLAVAECYARLATDDVDHHPIAKLVADEFRRSVQSVRRVTSGQDLLDSIPWLRESIQYRNRLIDPLNLIQIELMRRSQEVAADQDENGPKADELRHLMRLSINGIAAGMRTSG